MSGTDVLFVGRPIEPIADGVYTLGGQGNSLVVNHGDGLLLVDAGPGKDITRRMIQAVRETSDLPITHIVFSHGHMGYNFGVDMWCADARERGHAAPTLVGHARLPVRYQRYRETAGLQALTNTMQFRAAYPSEPPAHWFTQPQLTYQDEMRIRGSQRDVVVFSAPSETDDASAVWLPDTKVLYGSCAFIKSCPNAGSPYRIVRDPMRWAATLERFQALRPEILVPEFGGPLVKRDDIDEALSVTIRALHYVRDEVVKRMNAGMKELEIVHDMHYPPEIFGNRFLKPVYGCPEYLVREVWRTENGWWDRNATNLHPAHPDAVAQEVLALVDPSAVLARSRWHRDAGNVQMALHVLDLLAQVSDESDAPAVREAKELKAQLLRQRSTEVTSAVSRQVMLSEAERLLGMPIGASDGSDPNERFAWD